MSAIVFDIETGPAPLDELRLIAPGFEPPPPPGEFDPDSVKIGNLKDQKKIQAKVDEARKKHEQDAATYEQRIAAEESAYWTEQTSKAALRAPTGRVLAIGYLGKTEKLHCLEEGTTERDLIETFWGQFERALSSNRNLVGFNSSRFDVPYLAQRSWILGLGTPPNLFTATGHLNPIFIDLMKVWSAGVWGEFASLDSVCRACGLGNKPDDVDGAEFANLFLEGDREKALDYLSNDLQMTAELADRLGVL